jgi:hypothetical protein
MPSLLPIVDFNQISSVLAKCRKWQEISAASIVSFLMVSPPGSPYPKSKVSIIEFYENIAMEGFWIKDIRQSWLFMVFNITQSKPLESIERSENIYRLF